MHITCSTTLFIAIIPISTSLSLPIAERTLNGADICLGSLTAKIVEAKQSSDSCSKPGKRFAYIFRTLSNKADFI